ncbi:MAG: phosphatidylcholine/phosphatidylserine synthase [Holosporales bacterium]|nr:phosphatidylcholine/phosphatidylserine synthase [Holosporales bacterium]
MRRRNKKKILKNLSLSRIVPSLATLTALLVGLTQIRFALREQWELAVIALVIAAFFDATDGRLARLLNSCSRFGAELDSLSDFAVFGLCPAVVMYLYSLSNLGRTGWAISIFFAACMGLRLARFNAHDIENVKTPLSGKFFTGTPAPAGAVLSLFPIILYNAFQLEIFKDPYFCAVNALVAGLLCISTIPTLSIKKFHIRRDQYVLFLLSISLAIGIVFAYTWKAFCVIIAAYVASLFVCAKKAKILLESLNNAALQDERQ